MSEVRRTIQVAIAAFLALVAAIFTFPGSVRGTLAENFGVGSFAVAAALGCLGVVRKTSGRARATWALFSLGWTTFGVVYLVAGADALRNRPGASTTPVLLGSAVNALCVLAGVVLLYWAVRPERGAQGLIDAGSVVLVVTLGVWLWVIAPIVDGGVPMNGSGLLLAGLAPTLSFVGSGALGWVVLRRRRDAGPWIATIAVALLLQSAGGLLFLITSLDQSVPGGPPSALIYGASALAWMVAAQARSVGIPAEGVGRRTPPPSWSRWVPFLIPVLMILMLVSSSPPVLLLVLAGVALAAVRGISGVRVNNRLILERERLMVTDPLTGAFTRRHLAERLETLIVHGGEQSLPLTLIAMDLDNFKGINDTLGHAAGDRLLCDLVAGWRDTLRADDVLCRLGGDEFVIVLPSTPLRGGVVVGERLRSIGNDVCERIAPGLGAGVSCGLATMGIVGELPDELMVRADAALYRAKANRPPRSRGGVPTEVAGRRRSDQSAREGEPATAPVV